jgi:hypothetical protein
MILQPDVTDKRVQARLASLEVPLEKDFKRVAFSGFGAALAKQLFEARAHDLGEVFEAVLPVGVLPRMRPHPGCSLPPHPHSPPPLPAAVPVSCTRSCLLPYLCCTVPCGAVRCGVLRMLNCAACCVPFLVCPAWLVQAGALKPGADVVYTLKTHYAALKVQTFYHAMVQRRVAKEAVKEEVRARQLQCVSRALATPILPVGV